MAPSPDHVHRTPSPTGSPQARDRGLRRSRRVTRWIAVTAVAGAAALATVYTHLLPGGSATPAPLSPPVQNPAASAATTAGGDEEHLGRSGHEDDEDEGEGAVPAAQPAPQPPVQPPAATQQQPHTTTGAS